MVKLRLIVMMDQFLVQVITVGSTDCLHGVPAVLQVVVLRLRHSEQLSAVRVLEQPHPVAPAQARELELDVQAVGKPYQQRELQQGHHCLPNLHYPLGVQLEYDQQPDVCPNRAYGGESKDANLCHFPAVWDGRNHTDCRDDEEVEGGRAHNGGWSQLVRGLIPSHHHSENGEEDLRGRGPEGHQRQIGNCWVPHVEVLAIRALVGLGSDDLNASHEHVGHDGNAQEGVQESQEVQETPHTAAPCVLGRDQDEASRAGVALALRTMRV
mmetsp:Transcript_36809/g.103851  ORF Transcript_36809/g.103851 Transcript_36809/m.103851 type:complete len:268 (+) Transcript_36809:1440-2243(+)